jgi:hypothetical protein
MINIINVTEISYTCTCMPDIKFYALSSPRSTFRPLFQLDCQQVHFYFLKVVNTLKIHKLPFIILHDSIIPSSLIL